jgi:hypothetical protein
VECARLDTAAIQPPRSESAEAEAEATAETTVMTPDATAPIFSVVTPGLICPLAVPCFVRVCVFPSLSFSLCAAAFAAAAVRPASRAARPSHCSGSAAASSQRVKVGRYQDRHACVDIDL